MDIEAKDEQAENKEFVGLIIVDLNRIEKY